MNFAETLFPIDFALSESFVFIDYDSLEFPAEML